MSEKGCVLVCVTRQRECARLIDRGREEAARLHTPLHVIHVGDGKSMLGTPDAAEALNYLFSLAHEADAEMNILSGADVPAVIADYARRESACMLLLGTDRTGIFQKLQILLPETEIVICP